MGKSRWSIVMVLAWIAWRDARLVMEQDAEFRSEGTVWRFHKWTGPSANGESFQEHDGWFLEGWHKPSALALIGVDLYLREMSQLPASSEFTPAEAEKHLWLAILEERLRAEALDRNNDLVEIPSREWSHLQLFEERNAVVLKYHCLDLEARYTKVQFSRKDVVGIWPPRSTAARCAGYVTVDTDLVELGPIQDLHLAPMLTSTSHVPLSVAICWIMTRSGVETVLIRDTESWRLASSLLFSKIAEEKIEAVGRDNEQIDVRLSAAMPASVKALPPRI
jgi:hypothetical protein